MRFYYEEKMPLRILDEGEFWKQQESEHTVVIRELVSNLEQPFVEALQAWEQALARTQGVFVRYIEAVVRLGHRVDPKLNQKIMELVQFALGQSRKFIAFLDQLGRESAAMKANPTALVVLNHIRRESEYFIGIAVAVLSTDGQHRGDHDA